MQHLPDHFGPGPVNAVLQQVVQSCIDCAYQPKVLLSALQTHSGGGEVVRGRTTHTHKLAEVGYTGSQAIFVTDD